MTCFWNSLIEALGRHDVSVRDFIVDLQNRNTHTANVRCNGELVTPQQQEENVAAVQGYDVGGVHGGYMCSACDPFLLLVSEVHVCNIHHTYNGTRIEYRHSSGTGRDIYLASDRGHMWAANQ